MNDEGQADRDYWSAKYAEASCLEHGDSMEYDAEDDEWYCVTCGYSTEDYDDNQEANEEAYRLERD